MNRRNFLKGAATAAAVFVLPGERERYLLRHYPVKQYEHAVTANGSMCDALNNHVPAEAAVPGGFYPISEGDRVSFLLTHYG
jgi:hypothetical protein